MIMSKYTWSRPRNPSTRRPVAFFQMRSPFADDRAALHEEELEEGHARVPLASHGEDRAFVKDTRRQEYFSCGCCRGYLGDEHRFRRMASSSKPLYWTPSSRQSRLIPLKTAVA